MDMYILITKAIYVCMAGNLKDEEKLNIENKNYPISKK